MDSGLLAVNKLAGFECQPERVNPKHRKDNPGYGYRGSVLNFSSALKEWKDAYGLESQPIPIHRLDKPTTGVLLLARSERSARNLASEFRNRTIRKTYLALVNSSNAPELKSIHNGKIDERIHTGPDGRVQLLNPDKLSDPEWFVREALTEWEVLATSPKYPVKLLKIKLHTGVKHQIRIHMAHWLKAPIIGDHLYCKLPNGSIPDPVIPNPGGAVHLHASKISLYRYNKEGPQKRHHLEITAPLPKPFRDVCEIAKIDVPDEFSWERVLIDGKTADQNQIDS